VVAVQHGKAIFHLSASFQIEEPGVEHQGMMPDAPAPETLMTMDQRREAAGIPSSERWERQVPIDLRYVDDPPWLASAALTPRNSQQVWIRANGEMPEDPLLHVCAVTYASDMTLLDSVLLANGLTWDDNRNVMVASLDHAMWFHRPFRADDWLLYDQQSPSASGARGLAIGRLFTRDGRHVVSVVQEGLLRVLSGSK
jgi:acyl-CoA thioesterase-2